MRDPKRIEKVLETIQKIWKKNPDLRLMQLLINAVGENSYYIEDRLLIDALISFYLQDDEETVLESKETPMRPTCSREYTFCKRCGRAFEEEEIVHKDPYCKYCGQHVNWDFSQEEE